MLKNTWKIMTQAVLLLTISGWAIAGNLEPPGGPAPTMKTLQEIYDKVAIGTEIKSLPYIISSPGFYYITQDLTSPAGSHGITITADNVTLDLMGFSLVGPGGSGSYDGVFMNARTNIEIRNGTVSNFEYGFRENSNTGRGHRIINVRALYNNFDGIHLSSRGNLIKGCTAISNKHNGIMAGGNSTIIGNTAYQNTVIGIFAGFASTVTGNIANQNNDQGILAGAGSTVTGNTAYQNSYNGINAYTGSTVIGNTATYNLRGIYLVGDNLVDQNTAYNNSGFNMSSCPTCTFGTNHAP